MQYTFHKNDKPPRIMFTATRNDEFFTVCEFYIIDDKLHIEVLSVNWPAPTPRAIADSTKQKGQPQ